MTSLKDKVIESIFLTDEIITEVDSTQSYFYEDGVYLPLTDNRLRLTIYDEVEEQDQETNNTETLESDILRLIKRRSAKELKNIEQSTRGSINLKNGIYWITEKKILTRDNEGNMVEELGHWQDHNKRNIYYSLSQLPVNYNPEASSDVWDTFIEEILGKENMEIIYQFIGYVLLDHVRYQKALILLGSGKNGKTTMLDALSHFVGQDNCISMEAKDFERDYEIVNLQGKMVNLVSDLPATILKETSRLRQSITNEYLSGSEKFIQGRKKFKNITKHIFDCNKLPQTKEKQSAFYRRWIIRFCENKFIVGDNCDINKIDELITPEALSGLFNRALEGIRQLEKKEGFPDEEERTKQIWDKKSNPVGAFIDQKCIRVSNDEFIYANTFKNKFNEWRSEKKKPTLNESVIGTFVASLGYLKKKPQELNFIDEDGKSHFKYLTRYYGLRWRKSDKERIPKSVKATQKDWRGLK